MPRWRQISALVVLGMVLTPMTNAQTSSFQLSSPAFSHNSMIPSLYTCDGKDKNPPLAITGIPAGTKTLALIVDDPDAPMGTWVHWVVFNIPVTDQIAENSQPGTEGANDFQRTSYGGPCPPGGVHRYFFKLYALDTALTLKAGIRKTELEKAMKGHILGETQLIGLYSRKK